MLNFELYTKQVNGQIDVKEIFNKKKEQPRINAPDIELDYYVYRGKKGYASFLSANNKERIRGCNIKLIFDGYTNLLKDVKFIELKHKDNQKWKK